jgi:hypothetical protein
MDVLDLDANSDTTEPLPWDLDNYLRVVDDPGVADSPTPLDMGAFEYQP